MGSEILKTCEYCEKGVEVLYDTYDSKYKLCEECIDEYDNSSGYCSLWCAMGNGCDESC